MVDLFLSKDEGEPQLFLETFMDMIEDGVLKGGMYGRDWKGFRRATMHLYGHLKVSEKVVRLIETRARE
jgi:hypothetical protein